MKNISIIIIFFYFLASCGTMKEAGKILRNEKIKTTDEFLVKKRDPLVLPPGYEEIPRPGELKQKKENDEDKIKKILKAPQEKNSTSSNSSSIENSVINRINK